MPPDTGRGRFETTNWSLVLAAGDSTSPDAEAALAALCETYWGPVYAFVRRAGRSSEDAHDLTQAFFARMIETGFLKKARRERGRFRSFLMKSVKHFAVNQHELERTQKRGGAHRHVSLQLEESERWYQIEPVENLTPERVYERRWAATVLEAALGKLAADYSEDGRGALYERLKPYLTDSDTSTYAQVAGELNLSEGALRVAVHRLRRRWGECLRAIVADTVDQPEAVEQELRHLLTTMAP